VDVATFAIDAKHHGVAAHPRRDPQFGLGQVDFDELVARRWHEDFAVRLDDVFHPGLTALRDVLPVGVCRGGSPGHRPVEHEARVDAALEQILPEPRGAFLLLVIGLAHVDGPQLV